MSMVLQAQQTGSLQVALSKLQAVIAANERLLVVAASTLIMSISHTSLRPVLPMYAKVSFPIRIYCSEPKQRAVHSKPSPQCDYQPCPA